MGDLHRHHPVVRACLKGNFRGFLTLFLDSEPWVILTFALSGEAVLGAMLGVLLLVDFLEEEF